MPDPHECYFPEVDILEDDGPLKAGMKVLVPCSCGEVPLDQIEFLEARAKEMDRALAQVEPFRFLYHWSPRARRKQITRYGLRPGMRACMSTMTIPQAPICFADSPGWAWALSGNMSWAPAGEWDLWQTAMNRLVDPIILATDERPSGIYEVRTTSRVYKRDLWLVGSRTK